MAGAATFAFEAVDLSGVPTSGELEADSKAQVAEQLRQRGLVVLEVSEKSSPVNVEDLLRRFKGVPMRDLAVASRQFATLVSSGMPMLRALGTLEAADRGRRDLRGDRQRPPRRRGRRLAGARRWSASRGVFDRLYRAMVRSGEQSGRLEEALDRIATHIEKIGQPAPRGEIGADVPGAGLHRGDRRDDRDRRLRRPRLRRDLRRTRRRKPEEKAELPLHDPDHGRRLRRRHRVLVHRLPGPSAPGLSAASAGAGPSRGGR